jgi:hypothetical protein
MDLRVGVCHSIWFYIVPDGTSVCYLLTFYRYDVPNGTMETAALNCH